MSNNRKFQMLFTIVLIVIAFLATISAVNSPPPSKADLAWPSRPDFWPLRDEGQAPSSIPVTGGQGASGLSDYHQRHPDLSLRGSREADTARWQAMAEYYQNLGEVQPMERSRAVSAARWEAMAEYYQNVEEAQNLERGRAADAARWTAIAEYYM